MSTDSLKFETLVSRGLFNELEFEIFTLFETAVESPIAPSVNFRTYMFVTSLMHIAPTTPSDTEAFSKSTWRVLLYIAGMAPSGHFVQDMLVGAIMLLRDTGDNWKNLHGVWKELPGLGSSLYRSCAHSPAYETASRDDDDPELTLDEWINLNSFVAKLFQRLSGKGSTLAITFPIWELRNGLEAREPHEIKVHIACEWIIEAGQRILRESMLNTFSDEQDMLDQTLAGPVFDGTGGYNLERWGFWKRELAEVRETVSDHLTSVVDAAIQTMTRRLRETAEAYTR